MVTGLDSARLKVVRAHKHFDAIKECVATYCGRKPYEIAENPDGTEYVHFLDDPDADISVLAGEFLYDIRSALDHLMFDLVKANPGGHILPTGWEENCQFPMWSKLPKGVYAPPVPKSYFVGKLPGLSDTAYTVIESEQPYYPGKRYGPLHVLGGLSNIDKHRHLNVVVGLVQRQEVLFAADGGASLLIQSGLNHGAVLEPLSNFPEAMADVVNVERKLTINVAFNETSVTPPRIAPHSIDLVLQALLQHLEFLWIPTFEGLLKVP